MSSHVLSRFFYFRYQHSKRVGSTLLNYRLFANQNAPGGMRNRFRKAILTTIATTKKLASQTIAQVLSPPDPEVIKRISGPHSIGYKALGGSSVIGLGALCYYGVINHRDDTPSARNRRHLWPDHVRLRIRSAFGYLGLSASVTALSTWSIFRSRSFIRVMLGSAPWVIFISSLSLQIFSGVILMNSTYTRDSYLDSKHFMWLIHCALLGVTIAPMCYVGGAMVSKAFLITGSIISALSLLAFSAPESTFLHWSLPLSMGLGVVFASSFGAFLFPQTTRLGITLFSVYLYGGMIIFCGMLLYDIQRVIHAAELLPLDPEKGDTFDPINSAMSMYMDCLNISVRFLQLLALQEVAKRIK